MPSLKEFRNRIASVKSTQKITKAMQMVAAAKLKRAQASAEAARPYADRMARVIANLAAAVKGDDAPALLRGTGKDQVQLVVVMTSEREWGCYPELPGLSICQLVRREGVDAVYVSRWSWDGRVRTQVEDDVQRFPDEAVPAGAADVFGDDTLGA